MAPRPDYPETLRTLDAWFARGLAAAPPGVVPCTRGCSRCCLGLFDVSPADAERLAAGLADLGPDARAAVVARAREQLARYAEREPGWTAPFDVDALGEERFDALCEALGDAPCPALGDDGACALYEARPATCRMTGLALRTPDAGVLENFCPIQDEFPDYAALAPTPFDLMAFEAAAERCDALARERGFRPTTVAGALVASGSE